MRRFAVNDQKPIEFRAADKHISISILSFKNKKHLLALYTYFGIVTTLLRSYAFHWRFQFSWPKINFVVNCCRFSHFLCSLTYFGRQFFDYFASHCDQSTIFNFNRFTVFCAKHKKHRKSIFFTHRQP